MFLVIALCLGAREQGFLEDTRISRLVECRDTQLLISVFFDDSEGIFVGVEGGHEDEGNVDLVGSVEMLYLTHGEVKEGHIILDFECTLGPSHACMPIVSGSSSVDGSWWLTHGCPKATVDFEDSKLVQDGQVGYLLQSIIWNDLVCSRRFDTIPIAVKSLVHSDLIEEEGCSQVLTFRALRQVASEQVEEGLHLSVECLHIFISDQWNRDRSQFESRETSSWKASTHFLFLHILDRVNETAELVAHRFGSDTSGGGLEIEVTSATFAGGVCTQHRA